MGTVSTQHHARIQLNSPVSVIMPVLNEETHLATSVAGVLAQNYPGEIEIILAVGPSRDRTAQIAADLASTDARIVVIDNPSGFTPDALNLAIAASRHPVIVRVDAHGVLGTDYLETAVRLLHETDAANVGGRMDASGRTGFEQAVALAYNSRWGLGGGGFHLADTPQGPAESVFLGCFRRDSLLDAGGYDPELLRAQDWELNHRLRLAGEKVIYTPLLTVTYRPRGTVRALARQFFKTGQWRRELIRKHPDTASLRYLAPPLALTGLLAGTGMAAAGAVGSAAGRWRLVGLAAPLGYFAVVVAGSVHLSGRAEPAARRWVPLVLATMHLSWGAGFVKGLRPNEVARPDAAPRPGHDTAGG